MDPIIITAGASIALFGICLFLFLKIRKVEKRLTQITTGIDKVNLEQLVTKYIETLDTCRQDLQKTNATVEQFRRQASTYLRKIGFERFKAFDDTGGDQSFAIAVLDQNNSGFVVSSLYGRNVSKVYSKRIIDGLCENYQLTDEEQRAINQAIKAT
jgi:hypothetical protein